MTDLDHCGDAGSILVEELAHASVCHLRGDVDANLRAEAGSAMRRMVERQRPIVIDVSGVTFIDSSGLAFLIVCAQTGARDGTRVRLVDPPGIVLDLLDVAGATGMFDISSSTDGRPPAARGR